MVGDQVKRLSRGGVFVNGVTATAVVRFVRDYEETARIEDVAAYFGLGVEDVVAALDHHGRRLREGAS